MYVMMKYPESLIIINQGGIYNFDTEEYVKSKWILADEINGEIPGFILIKCDGGMGEEFKSFTHEIYFAFVRQEYRRMGYYKP